MPESSVNPELTVQPEQYQMVRLASDVFGVYSYAQMCNRCGSVVPQQLVVRDEPTGPVTAEMLHNQFHDQIDMLTAQGDGCE